MFHLFENYKMKLNTVTNPSSQLNKSTGGLKPVLPLLTEKKEVQDEDKAKYISLSEGRWTQEFYPDLQKIRERV